MNNRRLALYSQWSLVSRLRGRQFHSNRAAITVNFPHYEVDLTWIGLPDSGDMPSAPTFLPNKRSHELTMNILGASLRKDGPHLGLTIGYPIPGVIERIGADWDWIWIDGQHGQIGYQDVLALVRAGDLVQRPVLVRVPSHETGAIAMALDTGASGVVAPLVDTAQQASALVKAAKFPPLGERSYGGRRVIDRYGRLYVEGANVNTLLLVQVETPEALENADEIAAVPGVDGLFFGGDDMMLRLRRNMSEPRPRGELELEMAAMAAACREHNKLAVCVGMAADMLELGIFLGYNLIVAGADTAFLTSGSKQASALARQKQNDGVQVVAPIKAAAKLAM